MPDDAIPNGPPPDATPPNPGDPGGPKICWPDSDILWIGGNRVVTRGWRARDGTLRGSYPEPIPGRCGRRMRKTWPTRYCKNRCQPGRDCCRFHGGRNQAGHASGRWKHGKYSKHVDGAFARDYERARKDTRLLSLADDIAVMEGMIAGLLRKLDKGEGASLWGELSETYALLQAAVRGGDPQSMKESLERLGVIIKSGKDDAEVRKQLQSAIETKVRAHQAEWKRKHDLRELISVSTMYAILGCYNEAVRRHVTDPTQMRLIKHEANLLIAPIVKE
jgi:hypothetical protein